MSSGPNGSRWPAGRCKAPRRNLKARSKSSGTHSTSLRAGFWLARLRGRLVGARAARHCQSRAQRAGRQPALHRHQPRGRRAGALRRGLLRTRRDGKPDQRTAARALRRPPRRRRGIAGDGGRASHKLQRLVGQPVPAPAFVRRLRAHGNHPACRTLRHRAGTRTGHHPPAQSPQDRPRDPAQHAAHPAAVLERLPKSGTLRLDAAQAQFSVKRGRCSPRHPKNNGGKGHCLPSALKPPRESSNRTRPPDFCANTLAAEER